MGEVKKCMECSGKVEGYRNSNVCEKCVKKIYKEIFKGDEQTRYNWF